MHVGDILGAKTRRATGRSWFGGGGSYIPRFSSVCGKWRK